MLSCWFMSNRYPPQKIVMQFKTGDRVLCINADFRFRKHPCIDLVAYSMIKRFPKHMEVYTVRQPHIRSGAIFLAEISNPILINAEGRSMEEPSWKAERFIKLPKRKKEKIEKDDIQLQLDMFLELELSLVREIEINSV
jgi:hypothetical protein